MWGPRVPDARWLWSNRVLEVVGDHVDTELGEIAEELLAMKSQRRYLLLGIPGETHWARVFAAVDQLLACAVEVLRAAHDGKRCWRLIAEVQIMTRFDHPKLVRGYDVGGQDGWPYVVMELCDPDLETWAAGKPTTDVIARLVEAGRELEAMHGERIVHGDIKPENVLLADGVAKLADFGLAGPRGWSPRVRGTVGYIASEVGDGYRELSCDVFSFAATAWVTLLGRPPCGPPRTASTSAAAMVQFERVREGELELDGIDRRRPTSAIVKALRPALVPEPLDRPTLAEFLAQFESLTEPKGLLGRLRARAQGER
ncbi:Serine/threonine-protein kinase PrkC [Enhygromyxa salina]|uniref:Serine/threonine-protein kinase PrkC n=1 Tax=Enhygromyxa salina TaxID=215803 RepID=A0A2S9XC78_9BACT|nr:protein kinase [Enhygromyxa salina]PRP90459.1 Serine/threonine-protein kinase PrkC [Enhygromyxa salina]